jgi:FkbM family methyltransferase
MKYYPDCSYHLIEANPYHRRGLDRFARRHPRVSYSLAAAADYVGEIYFDESDPWSGVAVHQSTESAKQCFPCTTIDAEVVEHGLNGPYLLKLDTHGFEVPILDGARDTLQNTHTIVMETYNFHLNESSLTFWEMCEFLLKRGFRPIDLLEPIYRPKDSAFWQVDIVFARSDRPEFNDNKYA